MRRSEATAPAHRDEARNGRDKSLTVVSPVLLAQANRWLAVLITSGVAIIAAAAGPQAKQAGGEALSLIAAPQLPLIAGQETTLEIRVTPESAIPARALIIVKGAPAGIQVTQGRAFGPGVWVVPAAPTTELKLVAPSNFSGGGTIILMLTTPEGPPVAQTLVELLDGSRAGVPVHAPVEPVPPKRDIPAAPPADTTSRIATPPSPALTEDKRLELSMLLQKGRDSLRIGNIMHARQFYLRAAERGLAEAAIALAATYDPLELARMPGVTGVAPDAAQARKWYEKAKQLGAPEAEARLSALARQ